MQGVLPIIFTKDDSFSLAFNNFYLIDNVFIPRNSCLINKYGGCSLVVKRTVVVRVTGVRFSPSAFPTLKKMVMKKINDKEREKYVQNFKKAFL